MSLPRVDTKDSLCDMPATQLRTLLHSRDISAVELLSSCLARIELLNPSVNAVVTLCAERALEEALLADKAAAKAKSLGDALPVLHGLPLLVKDLMDTQGVRTTYGSLCFANHIPSQDNAMIQRMRRAGAIVLGKTNTPEFGAGANTNNQLFGATCNPFDTALTCGGSSGGSAVALACGMAPLATGSDLGGSLRIPASFCSVVGMRPSSGLVPSLSSACAFSPLWTDGPMGRTVADTAMALSVMADYEAADSMSFQCAESIEHGSSSAVDLKALTIGFSTDLGVATVDTSIAEVFAARRQLLVEHAGASNEISIDLSKAANVFGVLRAECMVAAYSELAASHQDKLGSNVLANLAVADALTFKEAALARADHATLYSDFQSLFSTYDVLVLPATAVSPFNLKQNHPETINGVAMRNYYDWFAITWALSLMACPVVTIAGGLDGKGLPFGLQVVGARYQDAKVLKIAAAMEQLLNEQGVGRVSALSDDIN